MIAMLTLSVLVSNWVRGFHAAEPEPEPDADSETDSDAEIVRMFKEIYVIGHDHGMAAILIITYGNLCEQIPGLFSCCATLDICGTGYDLETDFYELGECKEGCVTEFNSRREDGE